MLATKNRFAQMMNIILHTIHVLPEFHCFIGVSSFHRYSQIVYSEQERRSTIVLIRLHYYLICIQLRYFSQWCKPDKHVGER